MFCKRQPANHRAKNVRSNPWVVQRGVGRLGVARRRLGGGLAEDAAAGVAIFKTSNSSEPATAYFMGNAFRRRTFIFILWFATATYYSTPASRTACTMHVHMYICTRTYAYVYACATKRVYILSAEQCVRVTSGRPANFRLFSLRDFFLPSVRPTNDLFSSPSLFLLPLPHKKKFSPFQCVDSRVDLLVFAGIHRNFANLLSWRNIFQLERPSGF